VFSIVILSNKLDLNQETRFTLEGQKKIVISFENIIPDVEVFVRDFQIFLCQNMFVAAGLENTFHLKMRVDLRERGRLRERERETKRKRKKERRRKERDEEKEKERERERRRKA
jgi:hypothetical protein